MTDILAIDLGKTGCRAAVHRDGAQVAHATGAGARGLAEPGGVEAALAAVATVWARLGDQRVSRVAVGAAGAAAAGADVMHRFATGLAELIRARDVAVASDMTTWHAGALGGRTGTVVAAGTGAVALAVADDGRHAMADGWGHLLGDAGSGHDIGRAGLRAALRAHDGITDRLDSGGGASSELLRLAELRYGMVRQLPRALAASENPAGFVAAFATDVAAAARTGDPVSADIWRRAGRDLARTAAAAATRAGLPATAPVCAVGGLVDAGPLLTDPFADELSLLLPGAHPRLPDGDGLDGARLLAERHDLPHEPLLVRLSHPAQPGRRP